VNYSDKLRDPRWQRKRLEALDAADWACASCSADELTLHVHHRRYIKGREVWDYSLDELAVLCENCHTIVHELDELAKDLIARAPYDGPGNLRDLVCLMAGFLGRDIGSDLRSDQHMRELGALAANAFIQGYEL